MQILLLEPSLRAIFCDIAYIPSKSPLILLIKELFAWGGFDSA